MENDENDPKRTTDPELTPRAELEEKPEDPLLGKRILRYFILEKLGEGGMGSVYKAYDPELDRRVAIKLLHLEPSSSASQATASKREVRLLREAQALAQLRHPNVVTVFDVGTHEQHVFIAMEFVEGQTLRQWKQADVRGWKEILQVLCDAGRGLAAAHKEGLIHRDFKPDNIMISTTGQVVVLDFGLAKVTGAPDKADKITSTEEVSVSKTRDEMVRSDSLLNLELTQAGRMVGTLAYMAPEQLSSRPVDGRTDLFAFCLTLYEVLYGERPFGGDSKQEIARNIRGGKIRAPRTDANVPDWLRGILLKGLSVKPEDRYPSMDELIEALQNDPGEARRKARAARRSKAVTVGLGLLLGMAVLGGGILLTRQNQTCRGSEDRLSGAWDEAVSDGIREAFRKTGRNFALGTFAKVEELLGAYGSDWARMHTETCEATRIRGEQSEEMLDRRMRCLDQHRKELAALTRLLTVADADVVENAVQAVTRLSAVAQCADLETLSAEVPPPASAEARSELERIRALLAEGKVRIDAGKVRESLAPVQQALERATRLGYQPALAEASFWMGLQKDKTAEYKPAEEHLRRAMMLADESRYDALRARSLIQLASAVGFARNADEGLLLSDQAQAALLRLGKDSDLWLLWHGVMGALLTQKGKYDQALEHLEKRLAILEKARGSQDVEVANTLDSIASVLTEKREIHRAIAVYQRALALSERALTGDHPLVGGILLNLGASHTRLGELQKAEEYTLRAIAIYERCYGKDHLSVAMGILNLGDLFIEKGEWDQAIGQIQRALAIFQKAVGDQHEYAAVALTNLCRALRLKGEKERALQYCQRALPILERSEDKYLAWVLFELGAVLLEQGQTSRAQSALERGLGICERASCLPGELALGQFTLATVLWSLEVGNLRAIDLAHKAEQNFGALESKERERKEVLRWIHVNTR